jgi:hypothetical protein
LVLDRGFSLGIWKGKEQGVPFLCSMLGSHQTQSCQAERSAQRVQSAQSPWCQAPGPPALLWEHNFPLQGNRWKAVGVRPGTQEEHPVPLQPVHTPTPAGAPLCPTCGLVVVDVDPLQLKVTVPMVCARGVNAMFVTDHLPKLEDGGGEG